MVSEMIPELWLLRRHGLFLDAPYSERSDAQITVVSKDE
jgi:hypothetical protein